MTELLKKLIAIPRFSREEKAAADYLEQWLRERGHNPHRCLNNIWCAKGNGPVLLLDAHIDTVKPVSGWTRDPFAPEIEEGAIYGLGSNDDGGSLVALISAYEKASPKSHTLVLSLSAEEEVSGQNGLDASLKEIEEQLGPVEAGIIGEPTGMQMAVQEKGLMVLDCEAEGVAGHAARAGGVNAIYQALDDIAWFRDHGAQVTQINAGTQHNVIPDSCRFVVDVRTTGNNAEVLDVVKNSLHCKVEARSTRLNGSRTDLNHPLVLAAKELGIKLFSSPTLSNQAICPFPTVKIGPGMSERSHTADEFILEEEIADAAGKYLQLIETYENLG